MKKGLETRKKLLRDAFVLFSTHSYEKVSFSEMEKKSLISRGSMVYYFKNKEGLFTEMLKNMIFKRSSVESVPMAYRQSLISFYNYFIEMLNRGRDNLKEIGIQNMNRSMCFIEMSALSNLPGFREKALKWYEDERDIWCSVIEHAITSGEVEKNTNAMFVADMYEKIYLGNSFIGVFTIDGADLNKMKSDFDYLYNLISTNHNR